MSEKTDLIKKDLEEDFTPKFQDLSKAAVAAAAGGGDGAGKPPKPPMPPAAPKSPTAKKPMRRPTPTLKPKAPKASGAKTAGKPSIPMGDGMEKEQPNPTAPAPRAPERRKADRYHIYHQGHRVTEGHETVTLDEVNQKHGGVKNFESKGFRLVNANRRDPFKKNEEIFAEVMAAHKPQFLGDLRELAKTSPEIALAALPIEKADTKHIIAGEHIPTDNNAEGEKPKKAPKKKDEGSGGQMGKEEKSETCSCKEDECKCEKEELDKQDGMNIDKDKAKAVMSNMFGSASDREKEKPEPAKEDQGGSLGSRISTGLSNLWGKDEKIPANKVIKPSDSAKK